MNVQEKSNSNISLFWPIFGLAAILVFNFFYIPGFFDVEIKDGHLYGSLIDVVNQGSKIILLAIGMTFVIATAGVDLSVGSLMAVAGAIAAVLITTTSLPLAIVLLAAVLGTVLFGLVNGILVASLGLQPIVATLIVMVAGRGIAMLITDGQIVTFDHPGLEFIGKGHLLGLPFSFFIIVMTLGLALFLTRFTATGQFVMAVGENETASRFVGVKTRTIKTLVYCISAFCAALAGLIACANINAADSSRVGEMLELDAIFAVVVGGSSLMGGRFTLIGSVIGGLLIQTLTITIITLGIPPTVAPVPKAIVIVIVCLLQSEKFRTSLKSWFSASQGVTA